MIPALVGRAKSLSLAADAPRRGKAQDFAVVRCHRSLAVVHYSGARVPSPTSKLQSLYGR
jgi:hypothetical protein